MYSVYSVYIVPVQFFGISRMYCVIEVRYDALNGLSTWTGEDRGGLRQKYEEKVNLGRIKVMKDIKEVGLRQKEIGENRTSVCLGRIYKEYKVCTIIKFAPQNEPMCDPPHPCPP